MSATKLKSVKPTQESFSKSAATTTRNGVLFVCNFKPDAKEVYLVGEFNNWNPQSDKLVKRKGEFQKTMRLAPGDYQYKFLVDGEWHCDPKAKRQVPNAFGTLNSVVHVEEIADR